MSPAQEDKARRSPVQSLHVLQGEFKINLGNSAKPSLKIKDNRKGWGCCSVVRTLAWHM